MVVSRVLHASVDSASANVGALAATMARQFPATNAGRGARVISDLRHRLEVGGVNALALLGLVLLVVLITCVNVASLMLARAAARNREYAVRMALGASRSRLVRQVLTDSVVLGGLGAAAGLVIAMWLIRLLPSLIQVPPGIRSSLVFATDMRVTGFTVAVTLLTTVFFSVAPSWMVARSDVAPVLKGETGSHRSGHTAAVLLHGLVVGQVAVSLALLCASAVLAQSFIETRRRDLGITRRPVLTAWITFGDVPDATRDEAMRQIAALPGVTSVAVAIRAPLSLSGGGRAQPVYLPGQSADRSASLPEVKFNAVSPGYFATMGTRLLRGRAFTDADERASDPVMVVSERFAAQFFPGRDPLGAVVRPGGAEGVNHVIVGVVQDAVINEIAGAPEPYFYLPFGRGRYGEFTLLIGSTGDPAILAAAVRDTLATIDPRLEPRRLITMAKYIEYAASNYRATAALAAALGALGLLMTALGVYGVVAYRMTRRTREIGLRIALGATRRQVLRLVLRESARLALFGLAIGVPAALATTRLIASLLFGIRPWNVPAFAGSAALLVLAVVAATVLPAWRATRLSASAALREGC